MEPTRSDRGPWDRGVLWLVISGKRLRIAGVVVGVVLAVMGALTVAGVLPRRPADPMYFLLSSLLGGNLTLITVVISINQLVLSRELGSPGELRNRMEDAMEFRTDAEATAEWYVSPVRPGAFLLDLHESLLDQAEALEEAVADHGNERATDRVENIATSVRQDVREVGSELDGSDGEEFTAIVATLGTNHAEQLEKLDRFLVEFRDDLSATERDLVDSIATHLLYVDVARNYFRTIYVERELAFLSRVMLYVGVPAQLVVAVALAMYVGPEVVPASAFALFVPVAVAAGFAPLAVLFSFVLRLAWIAERNAAVIPFTALESDQS